MYVLGNFPYILHYLCIYKSIYWTKVWFVHTDVESSFINKLKYENQKIHHYYKCLYISTNTLYTSYIYFANSHYCSPSVSETSSFRNPQITTQVVKKHNNKSNKTNHKTDMEFSRLLYTTSHFIPSNFIHSSSIYI